VVSSVSALAGSFILWSAFREARAVWRLVRVSLKSRGTVRGFHEDTFPGSRGKCYFPLIEFTARDGSVVRFQSGSGSGRPAYVVGAQVPVRYDPSQPDQARVDSFGELWRGSILMAILGSLFWGATAFIYWFVLRRD